MSPLLKIILVATVVGIIVALVTVATAKLLNVHIPMAVIGGVTGGIVGATVVPLMQKKQN